MRFVRTKDAQGLPTDYPLKPHHRCGYESSVAKEFKRRVRDVNGHFHGKINIKVVR